MEVVASLSRGRTAAAQCGLFTHKSVPVIFEPPCISSGREGEGGGQVWPHMLSGLMTQYTTLTAVLSNSDPTVTLATDQECKLAIRKAMYV